MPKDDWAKARRRDIGRRVIREFNEDDAANRESLKDETHFSHKGTETMKTRQVNKLTRQEQRKLEDYVAMHRDPIESGKWSRERIAREFGKQIGRIVTVGNVAGACETMSIKLSHGGSHSRAETRAAICLIAADLVRLREELGCPASATIRTLAGLDETTGPGTNGTTGTRDPKPTRDPKQTRPRF